MKNRPRHHINLDQISKMIAGDGQASHWRINTPIRPPKSATSDQRQVASHRTKPAARQTGPRHPSPVTRHLPAEAVCWKVAQWIVLHAVLLLCVRPVNASEITPSSPSRPPTSPILNLAGEGGGGERESKDTLDPTQPPGANFDLTHWKLTLPDPAASEIPAAQLAAGYTNASYFYTSPDGAMTFWCPVTGGVTPDTTYPRCELREMLDPADDTVNWTGFGLNQLTALCAVTQVPGHPAIVIGQIHSYTGNAYPLVKLQYNGGDLQALVKKNPASDTDTTYDFGLLPLGALIEYQISLNDGLLTLTVNGIAQQINLFPAQPAWADQTFYFKAGDYVQDNSGATNEGGQVAFYYLGVVHLPAPGPLPAAIAAFAPDGQGSFTGTLTGYPGRINYLQTSADLKTWHYLLFSNTAAGRVDFTVPSASGARYYRGGAL